DVDPLLDGRLGHAEYRGRRLVLSDGKATAAPHVTRALRAVGTHPGQHDRDAIAPGGRGDAVEEHIAGGAVAAPDRLPVQVHVPGAGKDEVGTLRRDPGPGPGRCPLRG